MVKAYLLNLFYFFQYFFKFIIFLLIENIFKDFFIFLELNLLEIYIFSFRQIN